MIIKPKCKKFICTNSHPSGCALNVRQEVEKAKEHVIADQPLNVLVLGSSNGFGLSSRICAAYSMGANTLGIFSSKPPQENREGTAGWYNSYALARELETLPARHIDLNADAFAPETKEQAIDIIRREFPEGLDLVIYSIAAARRKVGDETFKSYIRPVGEPVTTLDMDVDTSIVREIELTPAKDSEIESTRRVMGGEDWAIWIRTLNEAGLLKPGSKTFAYTYIGSSHTRAVYNDGTIGGAKNHLAKTAEEMSQEGLCDAQVISQPAVVTQSSSVIPSISLYMTILMGIYKERRYDNSTQSHIRKMMQEAFLKDRPERLVLNNEYELSPEIQAALSEKWDAVRPGEPLSPGIGDPDDFRRAFLRQFGFGLEGVDYAKDVEHYLI